MTHGSGERCSNGKLNRRVISLPPVTLASASEALPQISRREKASVCRSSSDSVSCSMPASNWRRRRATLYVPRDSSTCLRTLAGVAPACVGCEPA